MSGPAKSRASEMLSDESRASMGRLGRGSTANFAGAIIAAVATFVVTLLITRGMAKADAGVFFSSTSLFLLAVSIGQLGTPTGLVYFLSRARTQAHPELLRPFLRAASRPVYVAAFLSGAALVLLAPQIAAVTNPGHVDTATTYLRVLGVFIPFASIKTLSLSATRGMGTMRPTVLIEQIGRPLVQVVLVGIVIWLQALELLPYAWALSFVVGAAAARRLLMKRFDQAGPGVEPARPVTREFWVFTGPRAIANVAQTAMQRFDIVLVGAIVGAGPAAVYTASTRFLVLGQLGNRAISMSAQPRIAEAIARGVRQDVNDIYRTSTAWLMLATWPIYLWFAFFGAQLMEVFGAGYSSGGSLLVVLAVAMLVATGSGMVDIVLNMAGRTSWNLVNVLVAFCVNLTLDLILIPRIGILGAALGWAAAIVSQNVLALVLLGLKEGLHPFGRATVTVAAAALVCFGLVPLVSRLVLGDTWLAVAVAGASGSVVYAGTLWRFRGLLHLKALVKVRRGRRGAGASDAGDQGE